MSSGFRTCTIAGEKDDLKIAWLGEALQDAALVGRSFGMSRLREYRTQKLD